VMAGLSIAALYGDDRRLSRLAPIRRAS